MPESPTAWGAIPVEDTKPPAKDSPQAWGAIPLTKTTNANADAAEEKQLADNIASYQEEKKQRDSSKRIARYFLPPATGMAPGVGSPGRQEPIQVPRVSTDEVASAFGISPDHAANLAGFMNSVSSPFVEFPFTPQGAGVAGASAIPGVAPLVGAGFTIKAFIDNPEMAREAGAGWVEAHNPQSTPEQKQVGWEKFWGAIGNIGIGALGAMPGAHLTETMKSKARILGEEIQKASTEAKLPDPNSPDALIEKAAPVLPNAAVEAREIAARGKEAAQLPGGVAELAAKDVPRAIGDMPKLVEGTAIGGARVEGLEAELGELHKQLQAAKIDGNADLITEIRGRMEGVTRELMGMRKTGTGDLGGELPTQAQLGTFESQSAKPESAKTGPGIGALPSANKPKADPFEGDGGTVDSPESAIAKPAPAFLKQSLSQRLEALKIKGDGTVSSIGLPEIGRSVWNTALDVAIQAIKIGKPIVQAIDEAMSHLKRNVQGFDEKLARAHIEDVLKLELGTKLWREGEQSKTSSGTSLNQIASVFKSVKFQPGTRNADIGGGKYDASTNFLKENNVENVVYDPFNRSKEHNEAAKKLISEHQSDTATVANVLNVIPESENRSKVIAQAADAIKQDGVAYFQIYEGDKTGKSKSPSTKQDNWQENRKAESYIPEIEQHFGNVKRKGNIIEARDPISQPPPQTKTSTPVTEPVKTEQRTAAESSLSPAIQTPDGQTFTGDDHVAAYEKAKKTVPDTSGSQEGFIDENTGEFLTREQAAAKTGIPTKTEEGKLHSTDLPDTTKPISAGKEGETKTAQAGISEGPGAASPGDVPSVQLDQLAQTFKSMPTTRTWADALKGSYDLGKLKSAAVDTVSRAVSGLKATGDLAKRLWENIGDLDEFKKILGKYSREVHVKDYSLRQFEDEVKRTMPKLSDQEAIASWVDAGGDMATLKRGALETTYRYRKSYEDAQKLTPEQLVVAKNIQNYFEARLKEAMDAGILDSGIEDYIHRIYKKGPLKDRVLNAIQSGVLDTRDPSLARKRLFEFDFEAEKAGLPIIKAFLPRILDYEASLAHAIASRAAVKRFTELKEADGNPMIAVAGLGRVVEDQAGVKPPSVIVNPHVLNEKQRGLYEHRDYPALQKWKWVTKDTDGKNVFVQGDVLIHKDSVGRIDKFLKPSAIRQNPVGRAALAASSAVKQTMLDLSGFHQVQLTVHALEHRVLPNRILEKIDLNNPDVQKLLEGGVTLGGKYRGGIADEGLWGKSLTRMIPGLGKLSESYHEYLFNDYIPRLKMTMAMDALERNRAKYGKKLSEEKLAYLTANEANAAFGELNYTMMERSKTWQDAARLILLAADFLEARGKFVGQALTKYGSEQRMALLLGATTMYVTARIFNKLVDGQYHFEKENLFNLVYKNHAYSLRTVQGDVLHLADKPISFWMNRLNPVYGRTALEIASGRDQFGRKRDFFDQVKDAVNTAVPISLRHNREQSILDSILISLGVTARKYSDVGNAYKLANDWRKKAGVKERPEVIYDPDKDDLYGLKVDLWNDDQAGAIKEIKRLIESGKSTPRKLKDHFNAYASSPFTGSRANDAKFFASLGKDDKITIYLANLAHCNPSAFQHG